MTCWQPKLWQADRQISLFRYWRCNHHYRGGITSVIAIQAYGSFASENTAHKVDLLGIPIHQEFEGHAFYLLVTHSKKSEVGDPRCGKSAGNQQCQHGQDDEYKSKFTLHCFLLENACQ